MFGRVQFFIYRLLLMGLGAVNGAASERLVTQSIVDEGGLPGDDRLGERRRPMPPHSRGTLAHRRLAVSRLRGSGPLVLLNLG